MVMRMSMMGLAGRSGMDVEPMCSMLRKGMLESVRSPVSWALMVSNCEGHEGSG